MRVLLRCRAWKDVLSVCYDFRSMSNNVRAQFRFISSIASNPSVPCLNLPRDPIKTYPVSADDVSSGLVIRAWELVFWQSGARAGAVLKRPALQLCL